MAHDTTSPELKPGEFDPFAGPAIMATAPSTEPQREIWTATQLGREASLAFNESCSLRLRGQLDVQALEASFLALVERHEALRATFAPDGLTLLIGPAPAALLQFHDWSSLSEDARTRELEALVAGQVELPFDLEQGPLFRAHLVRFGALEHRVVFTAHHIVLDGWSTAVLIRDWATLYSARLRGQPPALPEAERFSAYAHAQRVGLASPGHRAAEAYWLSLFGDAELPVLDLPFDHARPALKTYPSRREDYALPADLVAQLKKTAAKSRCSLFGALLAGLQALLARLSGQDDVIVGIAAAGQSIGGHDGLVGHCVNTLPIRTRLNGGEAAAALLRRVGSSVLDAFEQQSFGFGRLLSKLPMQRDPSRLPLVSILFNLEQALGPEAIDFHALEVEFAGNPRRYENFDLFVNALESGGQVVLQCQYNTDLLEAPTLRRWLGAYETLLAGVASEPGRAVGLLPVSSQEERRALAQWNATERSYPREQVAHELLAAQAARSPDATALVFEGRTLTYAELDRRSNRVARRLRTLGVRRDVLVGLCVDRSFDMVVGMLGILKAGGAYLPLDPHYPADRLAYMVEDSGLSVLVTREDAGNPPRAGTLSVLSLDGQRAEIDALDASPLPADAGSAVPESLAYVIYTSGSTGRPKGVLVPHRALVNFIWSIQGEPGLRQDDVLVAVTTLSFDIAGLEIFVPLSVGASLVLASRDDAADGALLLELLTRSKASAMQATPSTWRLLLAAGFRPARDFKVLAGGEALPRDLVETLLDHVDLVWNMYGPTETTIWSTCAPLRKPLDRVVIGRPLANTQIHVLDAQMQPVLQGATGEIFIGGDGVTHGYLNQPELTAERFVSDPFRDAPNARLYRTGDLGRHLPDGCIECLGRNDTQVKIRGFRIELGEIEAVLGSHPGVLQAVVGLKPGVSDADVRLVGYTIPASGSPLPESELRRHLRERLPDYMVPQLFVSMQSLPLTPSGKIDRNALPDPTPGQALRQAYVEPRNDAERLVAGLWEEALGVARLSATDNFFSLGGHSLLAAQVLARLRRDHGIVLPFRKLFEAPSLEGFATLVTEAAKVARAEDTDIPRRPQRDRAPLTLGQERLLFLEEMDPGQSVVHALASAFRLRGRLDPKALSRSIDEIAARHETLRTVFRREDGVLQQVILPFAPRELPLVDWSTRPAADREAALLPFLREGAKAPLDPERGPLFTALVLRLSAEDHVLYFRAHSAIWDGWSFDIFRAELAALYSEHTGGGKAALADLPISYGDFAAWHRGWMQGPEIARQTAYWREELSGDWPALDLPTDRPRQAATSYDAGTLTLRLGRADAAALTGLGRQAEATLFMVLLAAFNMLLARYSGQRRLVLGTPVRARVAPEIENLIGAFVNAVVLRSSLEPAESFLDYLERVRHLTLDAFSNEAMPFELLGAQAPELRAFFSLQDTRARSSSLGGLSLEQLPGLSPGGATDIALWALEQPDGLFLALNYRKDLFDAESLGRMLADYGDLLAAIVREPRQTLRGLSARVGVRHSAPLPGAAASAPSLLSAFAEQVRRAPDRVVIEGLDRRLTALELDTRSSRLARLLQARGLPMAEPVGLLLERSPDLLVAVLAVLKAGGACLPLDPADPPERTRLIQRAASARWVVSEKGLADRPAALEAENLLRIDEAPDLDTGGPMSEVAAEQPAWLLPVSAPAGPMCVELTRLALSRLAQGARESLGVSAGDVLLAVAPLNSEGALAEITSCLGSGARLVLADEGAVSDAARLAAEIAASGANVLLAPASSWAALLESTWPGAPSLRAVCSGRPLPESRVASLLPRVAGLWNAWGMAEAGVWTAFGRVTAPEVAARLEHSLPGANLRIVDVFGEDAPVGTVGELWVGGDGLARVRGLPAGVESGFEDSQGQRWLRTGVRARATRDGAWEWRSQLDNRAEIRGQRITPSEIEGLLLSHPSVKEAAVVSAATRSGDTRLVAYVAGPDHEGVVELRRLLRRRLPEAALPSSFVTVERLPKRPGGAVDRSALPLVAPGTSSRRDPRTDTERIIFEVWGELLGIRPSAEDNFFDMGGHSLLALRAVTEIERRTGRRLSPRAILFNTLEQAAAQLEQTASGPASDPATGPHGQGLLGKLMGSVFGERQS